MHFAQAEEAIGADGGRIVFQFHRRAGAFQRTVQVAHPHLNQREAVEGLGIGWASGLAHRQHGLRVCQRQVEFAEGGVGFGAQVEQVNLGGWVKFGGGQRLSGEVNGRGVLAAPNQRVDLGHKPRMR